MPLEDSKNAQQDIEKTMIEARDVFENIRLKLTKKEKKTIITLKSNIPGVPKNTWYTNVHQALFDKLICDTFDVIKKIPHRSLGGDALLYIVEGSAEQTKQQCMIFEQEHPLGRFIDLDVHFRKNRYSREDFDYDARLCFVCAQDAHACCRNQSHSKEALRIFIENRTIEYLLETLSEFVAVALEREVYLYPKFGLVSHKDSGAHTDMNIDHFLASIKALKPWFKTFLEAGHNLENNKSKLRNFGIAAEKAMFEATQNINTHKGAIFIFGAFLPFYMSGIIAQKTLPEIIQEVRQFVTDITKDDFSNLDEKTDLTAGEAIYKKYGLKGIREEVSQGFPSIMSWYPNEQYNAYQKLCAIMSRLEDTTIIKRHNLTTLKNVQKDMHVLLNETPFNFNMYQKISDTYKAQNISPGGSADLYALVCFLDLTKHLLNQKAAH